MPRYFFDIEDGIVVEDTTGCDLPDFDAAHLYALNIVRDYAGKPGMIGVDGGVIIITIKDAGHARLMKLRLVFNIEEFNVVGH